MAPVFPDLYKRSIYFEILSLNPSGEAQTVLESFAFTIPPTNIEIVQPQRVTSTPTPGGYFIDNYGLDGSKITISGETGNEESRLTIIGPGKAPRSLSGQEAYFEFRNRIERFSLRNENYTMRFYDLTHKGTVNIFRDDAFEKVSKFTEAWEVVLDESASRRTSAKPFFYPYSINLTGIRILGTFNPKLARTEIGLLSNIREAIDKVTGAISEFNDNMEFFLSNNPQLIDDIIGIIDSINDFSNELVRFTDQVIEYEEKLGGLFQNVLSTTEDIINDGLTVIEFPYDTLETARQQWEAIRTSTEAMLINAKAAGADALDKYDWEETIDPVSQISRNTTDIEISFNNIVVTAKQNAGYEPIGAVSINGVVTLVYGFNDIVIQENTRLEILARDLFGDPDFKDVISSLNDIYSNDELIVGDILRVPLLQPSVRYANNAVYNIPGENDDILGRDARVDNNGVFITDPGDYAVTTGIDTVYQAIWFRLEEKKGRQIRDGSYGIVAQIGDALNNEAPFEFLAVSLSETLMQDPRIIDVYGLNFIASGDNIQQEFKFDTITQLGVVYREGI